MVSTRGVKFKFSEGEKVLCYEPDPTKAKVLYDSKVLEVIVNKDQRGRKAVEYLIHFQGWNSSWDRCVSEDYVLKDTDENRQLQRDLAEKAQLQLGAYLYRRERKKRHRKLSEKISESLEQKKLRRRGGVDRGGGDRSSEDGSSAGSHSQRDGDDSDDGEEMTSSEVESSGEAEEERVPLELSDTLKRVLEEDHDLITKKNKVLKLPADPNVVTILEGYVKNCAVNQLCGIGEKPQRRYRYHHYQGNKSRDIDRACRSLNICKEVVDGVRIYFDFTLSDLLLYNQEREQFEQLRNQQAEPTIKQEIEVYDNEINDIVVKEEEDDALSLHGQDTETETEAQASYCGNNLGAVMHIEEHAMDNGEASGEGDRKRSLRSHRPDASESLSPDTNGIGKMSTRALNHGPSYHENNHFPTNSIKQEGQFSLSIKQEPSGNTHLSSIASTSSRCSTPTTSLPPTAGLAMNSSPVASSSPKHTTLLSQILAWQLVPQSLYSEVPVAPSLMYGAIHLARLFVKLPDLLYATNMPERKLKVLLRHLDMFLSYMEEHQEWFGEQFYKDNSSICG
ncbi:MSL complex subunit 3 isoform X2 [Periplaneta americana]|uniref:MSL complex subunit 3 isoform X2 n=1 Tax=Periplaneta americana TaxID=6978 RepID=UPI0037E93C92